MVPLNSIATLKKEQLNKKVNKIIATTEEQKMVKGKIYIKIVKIEAEEEVLVKKEQITTGLQNKMQKVIKTKITPHQQNQEINIAATKISINLGNSTVLENNKKTKQHMMWL